MFKQIHVLGLISNRIHMQCRRMQLGWESWLQRIRRIRWVHSGYRFVGYIDIARFRHVSANPVDIICKFALKCASIKETS